MSLLCLIFVCIVLINSLSLDRKMNPSEETIENYFLGDSDEELVRLRGQDNDLSEATTDVISRLDIKPGSRILELGCGPGFVAVNNFSKLIKGDGLLVAVDSSEKWINGLNSLKIGNIKTVCCKVQEADFQENEFDTVFCRFGLCWFRDVKLVLENITKWLKPGGRFACIEPIFSGGLMYPTVRGSNDVNEALSKMVVASGGDPWIGAKLPKLLFEAGLLIRYEAPFSLYGGPETDFFQRMLGKSEEGFLKMLVEKDFLSQELVDTYQEDLKRFKENPHSRLYSQILMKFVAEKQILS